MKTNNCFFAALCFVWCIAAAGSCYSQGVLGPRFQVGDQWVLEVQTKQTPWGQDHMPKPVKWDFKVLAQEQFLNRACFRVQAVCIDKNQLQPVITIWIDNKSGMLLSVNCAMYIQGKWTNFTETYVSEDGQPCAVIGSIPALPLDMPVFNPTQGVTKSIGKRSMAYRTVSGRAVTKSINNEPGFIYEITQKVTPVQTKSIDNLGLTKSITQNDSVEVHIDTGVSQSRQVWSSRCPWPVYRDNGMASARLESFHRSSEVQNSAELQEGETH